MGVDVKSSYEHDRRQLEIRIKSPDFTDADLIEIVMELMSSLTERTGDLSFEYTIGEEI